MGPHPQLTIGPFHSIDLDRTSSSIDPCPILMSGFGLQTMRIIDGCYRIYSEGSHHIHLHSHVRSHSTPSSCRPRLFSPSRWSAASGIASLSRRSLACRASGPPGNYSGHGSFYVPPTPQQEPRAAQYGAAQPGRLNVHGAPPPTSPQRPAGGDNGSDTEDDDCVPGTPPGEEDHAAKRPRGL